MSLREKFRLNFPLYFVLSLLFSLAIWSLWLPNFFGNPKDAAAAPITNFSTATNAVSKLPSGAQVKIAYNKGVYAMVFSSTSIASASPTSTCAIPNPGMEGGVGPQACKLFFTSSTDGGSTWGTPTEVSNFLFFTQNREAISDFSYDSRRGVWVVTYKEYGNTDDIVQSFSTTGAAGTWSTLTVISDDGKAGAITNYLGRNAAIAFATSSNLRAVLAQKGDYLVVGTTSNSGLATSWPTSTIDYFPGWQADSGTWDHIRPLGISIDAFNNIHAVYAVASSTATAYTGYHIIYASSTNLGVTWATTSISGRLPLNAEACFECTANTTDIDPYTGRLSVLYYYASAFDQGLYMSNILAATSSIRFGQLGASGQWTTSTIATNVPTYYVSTNLNLLGIDPVGLTVPYTGMYAGAFFGTSSNPYFAVNTSTQVIERINTDTLSGMSEMSTEYNSTTKELAVAYVDSTTYKVKFTTTSLKIAQVNDAATTTAITPVQSQNASGIITVSTTVSDVNRENVTLFVDYSLDHGVTWSSSTIASAEGETSSISTAAGKITGISTAMPGNDQVVTFTWDTSVILAASSTSAVRLRILADDSYSYTGYRQSASFTVDNQAPGIPSELVLSSVETTSLTFLWTASTGTPTLYMSSSTALTATATTTSATTTNYNNLSPNTQYLFQVKAQDTYSNTSSYATATSTYTDAAAPTAITASNNGTTSLIVSWTSSNGSGTNYQLYNVTTDAVVATTTGTSYTVTGLTVSTAYQFKVRAQFLENNDTYSSYSDDSTAVSTSAAASSSSGGGAGSPSGSPPPASAIASITASETVVMNLDLNSPINQKIGASEHTFTAEAASAQKLKLKVQSESQTVDLVTNVSQDLDTDNDKIADLRVLYNGLVNNKPRITVINLTDGGELKNNLTIQAGAYETNNKTVRLMLSGTGIAQVALSNTPDFTSASFASFSKEMAWNLSAGNGLKTVYAKLRSSQGGTITVFDTITLVGQTGSTPVITPPAIPVIPVTPPVITLPVVSIPPLSRTLKRNLIGPDVKQLQLELQKQGFFSKSVVANSVFGPTTEASVKAFEKAKKIKIDGIVDTATWTVLFGGQSTVKTPTPNTPSIVTPTPTSKPNLSSGSSGANVLWVQEKLKALGYFPKNVQANGYYGPTTQNSVRAFQKANGISQVGTVGPLTWGALNK